MMYSPNKKVYTPHMACMKVFSIFLSNIEGSVYPPSMIIIGSVNDIQPSQQFG